LLGIVFLDIDHFKLVNDSLGHVGGDELLKLVSQDLQNLVREGDTVARIGGDEFILLLPSLSRPQEAVDIAQRILQTFSKRRVILGRELRITTSIGISVYPEDGEDPNNLLANADIAMYQAKDSGRNAYQVYSPAMKEDVILRLALENDLRNAFERNEFVMHCQPIVKVGTGEVVGAEALIRWEHPTRLLVLPDDFIPFAADSGLIVDLDEWMLGHACAQAKAWHDAGYDDLRMAVNVSARTLQREDLVDRVTRILSTTGLPAKILSWRSRRDRQWLTLNRSSFL
jgi:diguanylate cyclase (GGDEF)-like protein